MCVNHFQHIDLRVSDMKTAYPFYAKLLPAVGFPAEDSSAQWKVFVGAGEAPYRPWFGFIEDVSHRPNGTRIAFSAASRADVDRLAAIAREAGARNMTGPKTCPEYTPTYYAAFFEDPSGNCLEICHC